MFTSFDTLVSATLTRCDDREKARIRQELEIINSRGWGEYILFASNVLAECEWKDSILAFFNGSVKDSYLVWKSLNPDSVNEPLLRKESSLSYLRFDALRLIIDVVSISKDYNERTLHVIDKAMESNLKAQNLNQWQVLTEPGKMHCRAVAGEIMVVSKEPLSEEEKMVITHERTESTEEEAAILRKNLIIRINVGIGL